MTVRQPAEYQTLELELFTVSDLTDAYGIDKSAELFNTSKRAIYTIRNTNVLSQERSSMLIAEIRKDELTYRRNLVQKRNMQLVRATQRIETENA